MLRSKVNKFHRVTHCIFDLDGTLVDTEILHTQAIENILKPYGYQYTYDVKLRCIGRPSIVSSGIVIDEYNLPISLHEYEKMYHIEVDRLMQDVRLMPGVKDLLLHLHEYRIPMAIATSSLSRSLKNKVRPHCNLMPVFHHIVSGDDRQLKQSKPAPDIFLLAASRFKPAVNPKCCLVFEDSPAGVQGAAAAGMQVVMIPDPRVPAEERKQATLVLNSMEDFEPELFGLPAYGNCAKFTFG